MADSDDAGKIDLAGRADAVHGDLGFREGLAGMGGPANQQQQQQEGFGNIQAPIDDKQEAIRKAHWDENDRENLDAAQDADDTNREEEEDEDDDNAKEDEEDGGVNQEEAEDDNAGENEDEEDNNAGRAGVPDDGENFEAVEDQVEENKADRLVMEQHGVVQENPHLGPDVDHVAINNIDNMNLPAQHEEGK